MTAFNNPFLLGFDELEDMLTRVSKGAESFPPYNLEQLSPELMRITLAIAGYVAEDLDITLEDNQLMIRGQQTQDPNRHYIHRGIAARSFIKTFELADGMTIEGACLENGLLSIDLKKPLKISHVQRISIQTKSKSVLMNADRRKK